jgi:hypothetical protein
MILNQVNNMSLTVSFFRWHRWIDYLVAFQVLAWILGGLLFAWLPFQDWIKCGEVMSNPPNISKEHKK